MIVYAPTLTLWDLILYFIIIKIPLWCHYVWGVVIQYFDVNKIFVWEFSKQLVEMRSGYRIMEVAR